jgi:hypothetical protein
MVLSSGTLESRALLGSQVVRISSGRRDEFTHIELRAALAVMK